MSTYDVPGARTTNRDVLAMGTWAEHADGSLIFVESVENGRVVYSIFDVAVGTEYRDAMPEDVFKDRFSWKPGADGDKDNIRWIWHDKTPFDWDRVMDVVPSGPRHASGVATLSAAERVARSLNLRAQEIQYRPTKQRAPRTILERLNDAVNAFRN